MYTGASSWRSRLVSAFFTAICFCLILSNQESIAGTEMEGGGRRRFRMTTHRRRAAEIPMSKPLVTEECKKVGTVVKVK